VVSVDGGVPLVSHAYAGNRPYVTQFGEVVGELVERFGPLAGTGGDLTLVYDAGQDSEANQELIETSPLHFVGSLPPPDHPALLTPLPLSKAKFKGTVTTFQVSQVSRNEGSRL